jgi:hypothetical protein
MKAALQRSVRHNHRGGWQVLNVLLLPGSALLPHH